MLSYQFVNFRSLSIIFGVILIGFENVRPNAAAVNNRCQNYLENCFSEVGTELQCQTDLSTKFMCKSKGSSDLCWSLDDAINCTLEVVNWSCGVDTGSFDAWSAGLRGVQQKLCSDDLSLIQNLIDNGNCWNAGTFLTCVEENVGLTHVADLLSTPLDESECNTVMVSIALCNAKAEKNRYACRETAAAVIQATTTFFSASSCMSQITHEMLNEHCASQAHFRAGVAVALTLGIVGVIVVVVMVLLIRTRIVTLNRRFRLYDDDDKENIIC